MMAAPEVVLAIDVGSSAIRAVVVHRDRGRVAEARTPRSDAGSGVHFDATTLLTETVATVRALPAQARDAVGAVGITAHIGTVFVDEALEPIGPGRGWADTDGAADTAALLDPAVSGRPRPGGGALAALLALRHTAPDDHARVRHALSPKDFLLARLCDTIATDHTSAAYTLAASVPARSWNDPLLRSLDIAPEIFPPQYEGGAVVAELGRTAAERLGIPVGCAVVCGGPDGSVGATLALGIRRDALADVAGTTDVLIRLTDTPAVETPDAVVNPYTLGGAFTSGGSTGMTGGAVATWTALLGLGDPASAARALADSLRTIAPGADGLRISPLLSGSRFPGWDATERGSLTGMTADHTAAHILRAAQEGAAFVVREGVDRLLGRGDDTHLVLGGGVARSADLAQLRADVIGRPVEVCEEPDLSAMGAALLALTGAGGLTPGGEEFERLRLLLGGTRTLVHPRAEVAARYDEIYAGWRAAR